jgi:hypothetical protein
MIVAAEPFRKYFQNRSRDNSGERNTTFDFQVKSVKIEVRTAMRVETGRGSSRTLVRR